jgi:hypothetical protein
MKSKRQESDNRCWCCGTRLVDKSRALNVRLGPFAARTFKPTGVTLCPHGCPPTREAFEKMRADYEKEMQEILEAQVRSAEKVAEKNREALKLLETSDEVGRREGMTMEASVRVAKKFSKAEPLPTKKTLSKIEYVQKRIEQGRARPKDIEFAGGA